MTLTALERKAKTGQIVKMALDRPSFTQRTSLNAQNSDQQYMPNIPEGSRERTTISNS